ncbi:MAG TPA: glycoside hydrolase family 130 protein [Acidobacteriaceae bacterium]|nr:glycoside hydrolase family 130 protein [Acidobacteriaceae bacterium]
MRWTALCVAWFVLAAGFPNHAQHSKGQPKAPAATTKTAAWMLGPFTRPENAQPVITARPESVFTDPILDKPVHWEALHTFNPAAVVRDGKIYVLYRAEDDSGTMQIGMHTSRLGLALSEDGLHFTREDTPVFYPAKDSEQGREWPGGTEDPRIVESPDGGYVITYTQWNRETYRVGIATSPDLHTWTKHGPAFGMGRYGGLKYKSAGIVTECVTKGRCVAAKIGTRYWMYWGEGEIHLATSDDLVHWTPVEGADGRPKVLMRARPGKFDSGLPEVGPPPVLTKDGIVLVYNGKNAAGANGKNADGADRDPALAAGTYSVGQALFAAYDPARLLARTGAPFFQPKLSWEQSGQYAAGTTFAEGLVWFRDRWLLYYGCADSRVGVATSPAAASR